MSSISLDDVEQRRERIAPGQGLFDLASQRRRVVDFLSGPIGCLTG